MLDLLPSPWEVVFNELVDGCRSSLVITSPFVSRRPCDQIITRLRNRQPMVSLHLLTDMSAENLVTGVTDSAALLALAEALPSIHLRFLPRLHAKVYVCDETQAVITSGNLTDGGLRRNYEYGVRLLTPDIVAKVRADVLGLIQLGSPVSIDDLRVMHDAATQTRTAQQAAEASARAALVKSYREHLQNLTETLLRTRVGTRSLDAVLSDTILFVLRHGPRTTQDLHREVQRIHPDLCDDTVDRVINGQRFGKKWKHSVRTAQFHLKKKGLVTLSSRLWSLVTSSAAKTGL